MSVKLTTAEFRERYRVVREEDAANFRRNWRPLLGIAFRDFLSSAAVGFIVGSTVSAWVTIEALRVASVMVGG